MYLFNIIFHHPPASGDDAMLSVAASVSKEGTHLQDVIVPPHPHLVFTHNCQVQFYGVQIWQFPCEAFMSNSDVNRGFLDDDFCIGFHVEIWVSNLRVRLNPPLVVVRQARVTVFGCDPRRVTEMSIHFFSFWHFFDCMAGGTRKKLDPTAEVVSVFTGGSQLGFPCVKNCYRFLFDTWCVVCRLPPPCLLDKAGASFSSV